MIKVLCQSLKIKVFVRFVKKIQFLQTEKIALIAHLEDFQIPIGLFANVVKDITLIQVIMNV